MMTSSFASRCAKSFSPWKSSVLQKNWSKLGRLLSSCSKNDDQSPDRILSLPWQFLRSTDSTNYDPNTHQRIDVLYDSATGKPILKQRADKPFSIKNFSIKGDDYEVLWNDKLLSRYPIEWVDRQLDHWKERLPKTRMLWNDLTEDDIRRSSLLSIPFPELITDNGMKLAINSIYQYGILLVTETPVDDEGAGIAALGAAVSGGAVKKISGTSVLANYRNGGAEIMLPHGTDGPLRTLYGTVWSTSSAGMADGASVADSAYGCDSLPLHTDLTYHRDPPGLQIFTMVQPATHGGESVFGDGFAIAEALRINDPEAFHILCNTVRRYRCMDEQTGWHLEANGPVIELRDGQVVGIRHNDLDRLPDLPPASATEPCEIDEFYAGLERAHASWDRLIAEDKYRLVMKLQSGDTMVVANQRCFHGRFSFQSSIRSPRSVMGCYISQDDLLSRFRMQGFDV